MRHKLNRFKGLLYVAFVNALFLYSCNTHTSSDKVVELEREKDSLALIVEQRDSLMNEVMETFYQIEKDLAFIKEKRSIISASSDNPEIEESRKDRIVQDVKDLSDLLKENKKDLIALHKKLKKSGVKIKNLEKRVAELTKSVDDRNNELANLKGELENKNYEVSMLNDQITVLETEKEEKDVLISEQQERIDDYNKAWFTLGTKKELAQKGLVKKEGGFLGLGKTKSLSTTNLKRDYFSEIDIRNTKAIEVNSEKVVLISEHPDGSYEFVTQEEQIAYMAINDVNEFYKFSKYVVLEVK